MTRRKHKIVNIKNDGYMLRDCKFIKFFKLSTSTLIHIIEYLIKSTVNVILSYLLIIT